LFNGVSSFEGQEDLDKEKFNMDVPCWDGKFRRHIAAVRVCLMQSRYGFNVLAMAGSSSRVLLADFRLRTLEFLPPN
jgi:hypothetical protein